MKSNTPTKSKVNRPLSILLVALLLTDCTVGPHYKRPEVSTPRAFRSQIGEADANSFADLAWWSAFNDKALQQLIAVGLHNNYDLKIAVARIEQARELVIVAQSEGKPQIGYQGFGGGENTLVPGQHSISTVSYGYFGGLLDAAWELDLWGRIRHATESAEANLLAQEYVRRGVMLSLVSDLAAGYFRLIELDRELAITEDSTRVYGKTRDLFNNRYKGGKDSELSVQRAQAAYDASAAYMSTLKSEITQQENALSVLAGLNPGPIERGLALTDQVMPETPVGTTTELLERRPDILQAEQVMVGANADIGVAVANFYPKVGLSALVGGEGVGLAGYHGFGLWGAALGATGPIFTGGRLRAIYHKQQAFWDETVAQYRRTVLVAFQETSDALIAQQTLVKQREALESQTVALQRSIDLALLRYDAGRASYFEVLEAEQQLYPAEYELAQTRQAQLVAVVNLYKALGGGWKLTPAEWAAPPETVGLNGVSP